MSLASSFRDPSGFCFQFEKRILRAVTPEGLSDLEVFLNSETAREFTGKEALISTWKLNDSAVTELRTALGSQKILSGKEAVFEHERVAFPSFPYEWPPEMLCAAAKLTLELAKSALKDNFGLKDATPYNILFRSSKPVFIDLLSFERRIEGDAVWKPYAQFVRTFLLPLLANKQWATRLADIFVNHRDGLEPEEVYRLCGPVQKFLPPFLGLVALPTWLSRKTQSASIYQTQIMADGEKARFVVEAMFERLRRTLEKLQPEAGKNSQWSGYMDSHSYTEQTFAAKQDFVQDVLREFKPKQVLDVGANTGHFSRLAAKAGARVVAIDSDSDCVGALWQQANTANLDILPLVVDIARPSAGMGWRNRECPGFIERAAGAFDAVFMLAVLHHLLVTERVPLDEVMHLAADLTTDLLVIEFVAPEDVMFRKISRGRDHLFAYLNQPVFEAACRRRFEIVRTAAFENTHRWIYLLRKVTK